MGCIGFPDHPVWEMTQECNLNCLHCHVPEGMDDSPELTRDEGRTLLESLAGVRSFKMVAFTGGEPLLRGDLFDLLAHSQRLGFTNTLATNATLVDSHVAKNLGKRGVAIAAVSLDGASAEVHDRLRGVRGAFDDAIRGMQALRKAGILLHVNVTVMEYNYEELEGLFGALEGLGVSITLVYQLIATGRGRSIGEAALDSSGNERLVRFLVEHQSRGRAVIETVGSPQYWAHLADRAGIRGGLALRLLQSVFHGCAAGRGFVYVKPDGGVWPCPFLPVACGNVREVPFRSIWRESVVLRRLRRREEALKGHCGECAYRLICGGCRARAFSVHKDYLAEDPSCFLHRREPSMNR
jgi:radical SAM protein with 4Fe4S-binding SPASM domain